MDLTNVQPAATTSTVSLFLISVAHILCIRAKKKMGGIATTRIVAAVKDVHSFCDFAMRQFPCRTVGLENPLFARKSTQPLAVAHEKPSVAITVAETRPQPAIRVGASGDLRPERFDYVRV